jgi:acyl-CoA synthetase (AMP-forming)/AMP-acid ligase II
MTCFRWLYTSGTTGGPKAVMHSHRTIMAQVVNVLECEQSQRQRPPLETITGLIQITLKSGSRYLTFGSRQSMHMPLMPIYTSGAHILTRATLMCGKRMVLIEWFHPVRPLALIENEEVNTVTATPSMWRLML